MCILLNGGLLKPLGNKGHIATLYCDVPMEKVIFKGEEVHVRI